METVKTAESANFLVHMNHAMTGTTVSRHFGPRTLRTQDISALMPKCPKDTSAPRYNWWQGGRL